MCVTWLILSHNRMAHPSRAPARGLEKGGGVEQGLERGDTQAWRKEALKTSGQAVMRNIRMWTCSSADVKSCRDSNTNALEKKRGVQSEWKKCKNLCCGCRWLHFITAECQSVPTWCNIYVRCEQAGNERRMRMLKKKSPPGGRWGEGQLQWMMPHDPNENECLPP